MYKNGKVKPVGIVIRRGEERMRENDGGNKYNQDLL
jgi:hypothetical protein